MSKYKDVRVTRKYGREIGASPEGEIFIGPLFIKGVGFLNAIETFGSKNGKGYMALSIQLPNGQRKCFLAHRLIAEIFFEDYSEDLVIDHVNGDKQDNSVKNLRVVTSGENIRAYRRPKDDRFTSSFRGVSFITCKNRWRASHTTNGRRWSRSFRNEIDAAKAWDKEARLRGYEDRFLNFPKNSEILVDK